MCIFGRYLASFQLFPVWVLRLLECDGGGIGEEVWYTKGKHHLSRSMRDLFVWLNIFIWCLNWKWRNCICFVSHEFTSIGMCLSPEQMVHGMIAGQAKIVFDQLQTNYNVSADEVRKQGEVVLDTTRHWSSRFVENLKIPSFPILSSDLLSLGKCCWNHQFLPWSWGLCVSTSEITNRQTTRESVITFSSCLFFTFRGGLFRRRSHS